MLYWVNYVIDIAKGSSGLHTFLTVPEIPPEENLWKIESMWKKSYLYN